ncbi:MAG TPA: hypothetical protein VG188_01355, partial [Solirubrobacteraceae bacterium]|nr:hypothetical protein [Solirubrobacteraceae bacterium]
EFAQRERRRASEVAQQNHARSRAAAEFDALKEEAQDAFKVTSDALMRIERAENVAQSLLSDHSHDHASRLDVAERVLGELLERIGPELQAEAERFAARLCDPTGVPKVADALRLIDLTRAASARETATTLHTLVAGADRVFSPLTTAQYTERQAAARVHLRAIKAGVQQAREHARAVGDAMRQFAAGYPADATAPAAGALAADEQAQTELHKLQAALDGETTTTKETTR